MKDLKLDWVDVWTLLLDYIGFGILVILACLSLSGICILWLCS